MTFPRRSSFTALLLVAVAISVVVNFSYLLLLVVNNGANYPRRMGRVERDRVFVTGTEGTLRLTCDGFGYIISESGDSVFVNRMNARWLELQDGDYLKIEAANQPDYENAHLVLRTVIERNGKPFDYGSFFDRPFAITEMFLQFIYYFLVALILLLIMNVARRESLWIFAARSLVSLLGLVALYFLAPVTLRHSGETIFLWQGRNILDFMVIIKCSLIFVVVMLYSQIVSMFRQREQLSLSLEQLKNENLTTRYNMLVSQINPHFFFNSLNSLSLLVREKDEQRALKYIDQLSYTFRYITQNGTSSSLVSVREEIQFAQAYCYLYKIRYQEKISFDFQIDPQMLDALLPALSLQPLLGNAVKHNLISQKHPFLIRIFTQDEKLVVQNRKMPLLEPNPGTGTGLKNLSSRYKLILQKEIEVEQNDENFTVRLPLQLPSREAIQKE